MINCGLRSLLGLSTRLANYEQEIRSIKRAKYLHEHRMLTVKMVKWRDIIDE